MRFTRFTTEQLEFLCSRRFHPHDFLKFSRNPGTGLLESGFESLEACQTEDRRRASLLRKLGVPEPRKRGRSRAAEPAPLPGDPLTLATTLETIADASLSRPTPACLASAVYTRYRRIGVLGAILELLAEHPGLDVAWVSCSSTHLRFDQNNGWSDACKSARERLEHILSAIGVFNARGLLIGSFRGCYVVNIEQFRLRYVGIVAGAKLSCIRQATTKETPKSRDNHVQLQLHPIRDLRQQISGVLPNFLPQLAPSPNEKPDGISRMQEPAHTLYLLWLAQHRLADLTGMHGAFYWDGRLKLTECRQAAKRHGVAGDPYQTTAGAQLYRAPTHQVQPTITRALPGI